MAYFSLSLVLFPHSYQLSLRPLKPEPIVTDVSLTATEIALGQNFSITVTGVNVGDSADMQIVSIAFPNLTRTDNVAIEKHNFKQMPVLIKAGDEIGSEYAGLEKTAKAMYASVEASSRPWDAGKTYSIEIKVRPDAEGRFVLFVKSVALPHSWEGAHFPHDGIRDHQQELVQVYSVQIKA